MSNASDVDAIERRMVTLVAEIAASVVRRGADEGLAPSSACLLEAFARQAVTSSEGGKRLRARLALAAYDAACGDDREAGPRSAMVDLACAIEVFQTAALIHDDIIDDSDLRRGKPSAHKALSDIARSRPIGEGLGLMLGDVLDTASIEIVNNASTHLPQAGSILHAFLTMQHDVGIGQVLDLAVELAPLDEPDRLVDSSLTVFHWKTASYTTIAPIALGFMAAGMAQGEASRHARAIGLPLGVAFQLADDLLDVTGSSRDTGKPVGGDIREGKRTVLLADALCAATPQEQQSLIAMFQASSRSADDVQRIIAVFSSTGAINRSRSRIAALRSAAMRAVDALPIGQGGRSLLAEAGMRMVPQPVS